MQRVPPEILATIAYYLAVAPERRTADQPVPTVFPAPLVPLLRSSKTIAASLAFPTNPQLYARIFAHKFDTAAIRRRWGDDAKAGAREGQRAAALTDSALAAELRTRCGMMQRLKAAIRCGDTTLFRAEDLFVVYLMLLENDGKNLQYLLSPAAGAPLLAFLFLYHDQDLVAKATGPGLPPNTLERTLVFWILWLLTSSQSMEKEEIDDIEEFLFCLRPYVFAATQFEITYAPWTLINLPLSPTSIPSRRTPLPPLNTYMTDSTPRSRLVHVPHYGTNKPLCPPILAHAAILNFFTRVDKLFGSSRFDTVGGENGRDLTGGVDGPARTREAREEGLEMDAPVAEVHAREGGEGTALGAAAGHVAGFRPRPSSRYVAYTPARRSEIFDTDYKRLRACYDPTESPGMAIEDWVGRFTGCWEGSFSFFDYDAYKSMLSGEPRALYEGQFGEQTQVWRLREVCVRPKRTVTEASESHVLAADKDMEEQTDNGGRSPSASPLNAGFELHSSTFDHLIPLLAAKRTGPLSHLGSLGASTTSAFASSPTGSITSAVVRILESDDDATRDDYLVAMLGGLQGQEVVSEQELEGIIRRRKGQVDDDEDDHHVMDESNDMTTGTQKTHGGEPRDGDDLELMLVGTGHSAWGEFLLRGRVRLWDGMVTLVKEYSPDGRGRWLYRGYIVGNNVFVGRWRDCVTPQDFVGYEGTFSLAQRIDEEMDESTGVDGI